MKRMILFLIFAICAIGFISAQGYGRGRVHFHGERPGQGRVHGFDQAVRPAAENVSINGNLTIAQGMIAVKYNDITYLVMGLCRFTGFIDGFTEGAAVSIEGHAVPSPNDANTKIMRPERMNFNGIEYDLAHPFRDIMRQRFQASPRFQQPRGFRAL